MPRYCDVNGDKKISLAEWLNCLQATPRESATTAKPAQSSGLSLPKISRLNIDSRQIADETASPKFQGVNPVERYLKD